MRVEQQAMELVSIRAARCSIVSIQTMLKLEPIDRLSDLNDFQACSLESMPWKRRLPLTRLDRTLLIESDGGS